MAIEYSDLTSFAFQHVPGRCSLKSAVMEFTIAKRGFGITRVDSSTILAQLPTRTIPFVNMNGPASSTVGRWFCDRKDGMRALANHHGIPTPKSAVFTSSQKKLAVEYADSLDGPVVVKPVKLSKGRGVSTNVVGLDQFLNAWTFALSSYKNDDSDPRVLVEEHVTGDDFRFFVVDGRVVSVTHRVRANVVGNGRDTVRQLILAKNMERSTNPNLRPYAIPDDENLLDALASASRDLTYVPDDGELVVLRNQSNLSAGGDSIDVTDMVAKPINNLAVSAVKVIPGLPHAGVDIMTTSITDPDAPRVVTEVEYSPGTMAHFPMRGQARDMAGAILDYYLSRG